MTRSSVPCTTTTGQRTVGALLRHGALRPGRGRPRRGPGSRRRCLGPSPRGPRSAWSSAPRAPAGRRRSRGTRGSRAATSTGCSGPSPRRPRCPRPSGRTPPGGPGERRRGPGSTARSRPRRRPGRGGRRRGRGPAGCPSRAPTTTARRVPVASSTSSASCVSCSRVYAELVVGPVGRAVAARVEGDHPRPAGQVRAPGASRPRPARCTTSAAAAPPGRPAGPGSPYVCQATRTPSRSTNPVRVGLACLHGALLQGGRDDPDRGRPAVSGRRTGRDASAKSSMAWLTTTG